MFEKRRDLRSVNKGAEREAQDLTRAVEDAQAEQLPAMEQEVAASAGERGETVAEEAFLAEEVWDGIERPQPEDVAESFADAPAPQVLETEFSDEEIADIEEREIAAMLATVGNNNSKKEKGKRKKGWIIGLAAAVVCILGVGAYAYFSGWFEKEPTLSMLDNGLIAVGVSVEEVKVGGDTPAAAREKINELIEESHAQTVLPIVISDRTEKVPINMLGIGASADTALRSAMEVGRNGGIEKRRKELEGARSTGVQCELKYEFDENTIREAVTKYCESIPQEPAREEVTFDPSLPGRFKFSERKDGFRPETETFVNMVLERVKNWDFSEITMPGEAVKSDGTPSDVIANTVLISKRSTSFAGSSYGRSYNIKLGLQKINGKIVQPGESFSVEKALGNTTDGRIWKSAGAIENGVPTNAIGGGICQVSTTLFNAVVRADLQIDEWYFHSIRSSYTPIGTDAALNYGGADFRFTNNTEWPIYIVAYTSGSTAWCEIWGRPIPNGGSIDIIGIQTGTIPQPADIIVTNPKDVSGGRMGYRCTTYKIYKDANGKEIKRVAIKSGTYPARAARVLKTATPTPTPDSTPKPTTEPTPTPAPTSAPTPTPEGQE